MKTIKFNSYIINVEEILYVGYDIRQSYKIPDENGELKECYEVTILFKNSTSIRIKFDTIEEAEKLLSKIQNKMMESEL